MLFAELCGLCTDEDVFNAVLGRFLLSVFRLRRRCEDHRSVGIGESGQADGYVMTRGYAKEDLLFDAALHDLSMC